MRLGYTARMLSLLALTSVGWSQSILLVGNSYTFFNDLDRTSIALLEAGAPADWAGGQGAKLAGGGLTFEAHLANTQDKKSPWYRALASGDQAWDWVVLQEQSQIPGFPETNPDNQSSVVAAAGLDDLVEARGGETVFLMTWGRREGDALNESLFPDFSTMQERLQEGYLRYRDETGTDARPTWIAPAGLAFAHIHDGIVTDGGDPLAAESLFSSLYTDDGSHPSPFGTYLTASVIYVTVTGESAVGLPDPSGAIEATILQQLQEAADAAVFGSTKLLDYPWETDTPDPEDTGEPDSGTPDTSDPSQDTDEDTDEPDTAGEDLDKSGCRSGGAALFVGALSLLGWRRRA